MSARALLESEPPKLALAEVYSLTLLLALVAGSCVHITSVSTSSFSVMEYFDLLLTYIVAFIEDLLTILLIWLICKSLCRELFIVITLVVVTYISLCDTFLYAMLTVPLTLDGLSVLVTKPDITLPNVQMLSGSQALVLMILLAMPILFPLSLRTIFSLRMSHIRSTSRFKKGIFFSSILLLYLFTFHTISLTSVVHNPIVRLSYEALYELSGKSTITDKNFIENELSFLKSLEEELVQQQRASSSNAARPSLFIIMLESVRASALPIYNPAIPPEVTPFLSSLMQLNPKNTNGTFLDGARVSLVESMYAV